MVLIRDPAVSDEPAWRRLWAGYLDFYAEELPEAVTAGAWRRILDPAEPLVGRLAEREGVVVGFSLSVLHAGTWTLAPICYLEDLYVAPEARGAGAGRALVQDLVDLARERGWGRLYWHTRADNPARTLYDRFAPADDFVRYRRLAPLPGDIGGHRPILPRKGAEPMTREQAVLAAEARLIEAQLASDAGALDALLANDLVFVAPDGRFMTKADDLDAHRSGALKFERFDLIERRLQPAGDCMVAMVQARIGGRWGDEPFGGRGVWTRVWRPQGDGWVVAAAHCANLDD